MTAQLFVVGVAGSGRIGSVQVCVQLILDGEILIRRVVCHNDVHPVLVTKNGPDTVETPVRTHDKKASRLRFEQDPPAKAFAYALEQKQRVQAVLNPGISEPVQHQTIIWIEFCLAALDAI